MHEGIPLLIVGMGTVFSFLILMVLSMMLKERLLRPWADSEGESSTQDADEMERIAVVVAAAFADRDSGPTGKPA